MSNQLTAVRGVKRDEAGNVIAFNINRKKWGRGENGGWLLQYKYSQGKQVPRMCCLGLYARACGVSVNEIYLSAMPSKVGEKLPEQMQWTVQKRNKGRDSKAALKLADINDDEMTEDEDKEAAIIKHFAKQGITVTFTG